MQGYINIMVRVNSARALQQLKQVGAATEGVSAAQTRAAAGPVLGIRQAQALTKWGSQLQWAGRQIQYNFTLPLALAAGMATKWQLENEKAFVHVRKVYGDTAAAAAYFRKNQDQIPEGMTAMQAATSAARHELTALQKAFESISNEYGVQRKEVLDVAGAWAQAGKSGIDLAKAVDQTMQAMIIGDLNSADATKSLIAIQAQYNLSAKQMTETLANLNAIENQTGIDMGGLIQGFERAAGVARAAGVDVRHLGALLAALVPAAGSAANAGNALKTILSRLMAPTQDTMDLLNEMKLNINSKDWQSATALDRLMMMDKAFEGLSKSAQNTASSIIASRWQVNKFNILMGELASNTGYYQKALDATSSRQKVFNIYQKELNQVLSSNPQRLKQMWVIMQNALTDVIQPLIPYLLYLVNEVKSLVLAFSNMNPLWQKVILLGLASVAIFGLVAKYVGATAVLFGLLGRAFEVGGVALGIFTREVAVAGVGTVVMRKGIIQLLESFTIEPIKRFGQFLWNTLGSISGFLTRFVLFAPGFLIASVRTWAVMWGSIIAITKSRIIQLQLLQMAGAFEGLTIWQKFWRSLQALYIVGWTNIGKILKGGALVRIWTTVAGGIFNAWKAAWLGIVAVGATGSATVVAEEAAAGVASVGIWTRVGNALRGIWAATKVTAITLFSGMGRGLGTLAMRLVPLLLSPWTILAGAIIAVLFIFRKQIAQIWDNIIAYFANSGNALPRIWQSIVRAIAKAFDMLPQSVQNALVAVVRIVSAAAKQVYEWFSYLNPFAHHSPSLVENVQGGMATVNRHLQTVQQSGASFRQAHKHVENYGNAVATLPASDPITRLAGRQQRQDQRSTARDIAKQSPAAANEYLRLAKIVDQLTPKLNKLNLAVEAQQKKVDAAQAAVDKWNNRLEAAQKKLDGLQAVADKWSQKLQDAQNSLSTYASTPIKGMQAMNDQIEANTVAQTKLQWRMMQMEKVTGTLDDVKGKLDAINGAQELLKGQRADLRAAGAGSDVLSQYDNQIKALDQNKAALQQNADELQSMQDQLTALQKKADELDLEKRLKFDHLQYEIEKASQTMKEMPFDQIMKGIQGAQANIAKYTPEVNKANAAVKRQQAVVDGLTKSRDKAQARLDLEQNKLQAVQKRYDSLNNTIQALKDRMDMAASAAQGLNQALSSKKASKKGGASPALSPALQAFNMAKKGNFPDPGGAGAAIRKNWGDQSKMIDKFAQQMANQTAGMFKDINPFAPLKQKAAAVWDWIKKRASEVSTAVSDFFSKAFAGVNFGDVGGNISKTFSGTFKFITKMIKDISNFVGAIYRLFAPDIKRIFQNLIAGFKDIWQKVGPQLAAFKDLLAPLGQALKNIWLLFKLYFARIAIGVLFYSKIIFSIIGHILKPALDMIGTVLAAVIRIVRGLLQILIGIFTLNFGMIATGVGNIIRGLWDGIIGIIWGAIKIIGNAIWGFVTGFVGFFKWLFDELVGHSIIPDLVDAVIWYFKLWLVIPKWIWNHVLKPVVDFFVDAWNAVRKGLAAWWEGIKKAWDKLKEAGAWVKKHVLQPVLDAAQWVWKRMVNGFKRWWTWLKKAWDKLKDAGGWIKKHVFQPVLDAAKWVWTRMVAGFKQWWAWLKQAWKGLQNAERWIWNNVFVGVWKKVKGLWTDYVKPELNAWWGRIKTTWNNLTGLPGWIWNNVMAPIKQKIIDGWNAVKRWLVDNKDLLMKPVSGVVNAVINAINFMIKGLNKISDVLPGIDFHIDLIPKMAVGGEVPKRRVGSGFKTTGARAIVGEGKPNHPEFVIPTDPTYRNRALSLYKQLGAKLGSAGGEPGSPGRALKQKLINGVPAYGIGGVIGDIAGAAKAAGGWIKGKVTQLASLPFKPFKAYAEHKINEIHWNVAKAIAQYGLNKVLSWVHLADQDAAAVARQHKKLQAAKHSKSPAPTAGGDGRIVSWRGQTFDMQTVRAIQQAEKYYGGQFNITQGSYSTRVSASGSTHSGGGAFDETSPVNSRALAAIRKAHFAAWIRNPSQGPWPYHIHAILIGDPRASASAKWQVQDYLNGGDGLKYGAIVRRRAGGVLARVGEGSHDEAVTPLPHGWRANMSNLGGNGSGNKTYNFYGDLSFPNITKPDDAKTFLDNLEILIKD